MTSLSQLPCCASEMSIKKKFINKMHNKKQRKEVFVIVFGTLSIHHPMIITNR